MAGVTGDFAALDALLEALDGEDIAREVRERAAVKIGDVAAAQHAAGQGPDGAPWPSNRDGSVPLREATSEIVFTATESGVQATGPDVLRYHEQTRPVFPPAGELSAPWAAAADEAAMEVLEERFGKVK